MSGTSSSTSSSTSSFGHPLVREVDPAVDQQRVPGAEVLLLQPVGQPDHALLVTVPDDQAADAVLEDLLEQHDLADLVEVEHVDEVEGLVDHDLAAGLRASRSTSGLTLTRILRPEV